MGEEPTRQYVIKYTCSVKVPSDQPGSDKYGNKEGYLSVMVAKDEPVPLDFKEETYISNMISQILAKVHKGIEHAEVWMRDNPKIEFTTEQVEEMDQAQINNGATANAIRRIKRREKDK